MVVVADRRWPSADGTMAFLFLSPHPSLPEPELLLESRERQHLGQIHPLFLVVQLSGFSR